MKILLAAVAMTALIGSGSAVAQTDLDHRVQRAWDDVFSPPPPGDPRTNWERRRDQARYQERRETEHEAWARRREADRAEWCRYHPGADGCGRSYSERYYGDRDYNR